jgi:hypothetical protein
MIGILSFMVVLLPEVDLDLYLAPPPPPVRCAADMLDYPIELLPFSVKQTFHYREGDAVHPLEMQPGYLVSECELMRLTNMKIELKRLKLDLQAVTRLRTREFELWRVAEQRYQRQIDSLAFGWWARNKLYVGIVIGIAAMSVTTWTSVQLLR